VKRPERVLRILRGALDRGMRVEIEGLGVFRKASGVYSFDAQTRPQVFVAYAVEDLHQARRLCAALAQAGCSPWLDKDKLLPGQNWPRAIERAIEISRVRRPSAGSFKASSAMHSIAPEDCPRSIRS
jgi:hypothetical protein